MADDDAIVGEGAVISEEIDMEANPPENAVHHELIAKTKRAVKQLMEEGVGRATHEGANAITALCASVETALADGLRRRVLGLFGGTASTFALLHKIAKLCPPAAHVLAAVLHAQQQQMKNRRSLSGSGGSFSEVFASKTESSPANVRYLWIRVALLEKRLAVIVDFIAVNASRYYNSNALMMDPVHSTMLASLLVGPCALEYTKVKTMDTYMSDPSADELVQRHRIHSGNVPSSAANVTAIPHSPRRPALQVRRIGSLSSLASNDDYAASAVTSTPQKYATVGRDYVLSIHQNIRSTLLYGKNNVSVHPNDLASALKGYLSLHQNGNGSMSIKWTPNELMNAENAAAPTQHDRNGLWKYSLNLNIEEIIYLHFHQGGSDDSSGTIVFVGTDGTQYPPVHFPTGQHPLTFLSCLENGLLPWSQLDPPLWLQKGKGKVFPKLRRKSSYSNGRVLKEASSTESLDSVGIEQIPVLADQDYVFRIVPAIKPSSSESGGARVAGGRSVASSQSSSRLVALSSLSSLLKERFMSLSSSPASSPPSTPRSTSTGKTLPTMSTEVNTTTVSAPTSPPFALPTANVNASADDSGAQFPSTSAPEQTTVEADEPIESTPRRDSHKEMQVACNSMRNQILSRAFYGWLAHCRHLKTVRTHLSCLVRQRTVDPRMVSFEEDVSNVVDEIFWRSATSNPTAEMEQELYKRTYLYGVSPSLRFSVWPYLLEWTNWGEDVNERRRITAIEYDALMLEWLAVEAIVRQCDKESLDAARDREWREANAVVPPEGRDPTLPTEQFHETIQARFSVSSTTAVDDDDEEETPTAAPIDDTEVTAALENGEILCETTTSAEQSPSRLLNEAAKSLKAVEEAVAASSGSRLVGGSRTPEEGDGGTFSKELIDTFALNLHRIDKDVHRCDRNYAYFTDENLEKLKNVMCTYVWKHLDCGYVQGMCDLAAPLLVTFDDEVMTYGCFSKLMERMLPNFPHGGGMDIHLANMRSLIQVMDPELFDLMQRNGDYTHFYFCYRWFLLDFKRELPYADVFTVWETVWAAAHVASAHFVLFLALSLLSLYRNIILENNMDFTDIIKFFNEMAERHDAKAALHIARNLVKRLQDIIESNSKSK